MIEKIKEIIKKYDLKSSTRKREKVYQRFYIYSELKKIGLTQTDIGILLDKDHASVIHGLKVDKLYQNCDNIYDENIAPIKRILYPQDTSVELPKYSIFEDVIRCNNTTDLRIIKQRIENNQYRERDK
jgi:hypothetical protein